MPNTADIRVTDISSDITQEVPSEHKPRAARCLDIFEAHCPISKSVEAGVTLHITDEFTPMDD